MKEKLSYKNTFFLCMVCIISSNMIVGFPPDLGQDVWISILLSIIPLIPLTLLRTRMMKIMPEMNLYDMAIYSLGKIAGKIACIIFGLYCFFMISIVTYSFSEFIHLTTLYKTPRYLIIFMFFFASLYLATKGVHTISKWSVIIISVSIVMLTIITAISLPKIDFNNLLPIGSKGPKIILNGVHRIVALPFGEIIVLLTVAEKLQNGKKNFKVQMGSILLGVLYFLVISLRACAILTPELFKTVIFQNYKAVSMIKVSDFFERIESLVTFVYILTCIGNIAVFMTATAKSVKKVFNFDDYKSLLLPLGAIALAIAISPFHDIVQVFEFVHIYDWFSMLPQIGVPLAIWIGAEIKQRKKNNSINPLAKIQSEIDALENSSLPQKS